jgi:hypothetical protein
MLKNSDTEQTDLYMYVKSAQKQAKQETDRTLQQYPETIKASLSKKHGVKREEMVNRRIGRAIEKYPSISKLYDIELQVSDDKTVSAMTWKRNETKRNEKIAPDSLYFVRCSLKSDHPPTFAHQSTRRSNI